MARVECLVYATLAVSIATVVHGNVTMSTVASDPSNESIRIRTTIKAFVSMDTNERTFDSTNEMTKITTRVGASDSTNKWNKFTTPIDTSDSANKWITVTTPVNAYSSTNEGRKETTPIDASDSTKEWTKAYNSTNEGTRVTIPINAYDSINEKTKVMTPINASDSTTRFTTTEEDSDSTHEWPDSTNEWSDSTNEWTKETTPIDTFDPTNELTEVTTPEVTFDSINKLIKVTTAIDASDSTKGRMKDITSINASDSIPKSTTPVDASDSTTEWTKLTTPVYTPDSTKEWTNVTIKNDKPDNATIEFHQPTMPEEPLNITEIYSNNQSDNTNSVFSSVNSLPRVIPVTSIFVGFIVMTLNIIVMVASIRNRELRQNTNYNLVMGLSLSDFLLGFSMFLAGFRLNFPSLIRMLGWCVAVNLSTVTSVLMSLLQTFYISLHRYLVLSESARARLFDNGKYYLYIAGWTIIITLFSLLISPDGDQSRCSYKTIFGPNIYTVGRIICVFSFILLLLTLIFYSLAIYQIPRRYMNASSISNGGQMEDRKRKRFIKSMKLVTMIIAALYLFTGPMIISLMFDETPHSVIVSTFVAANFNSFLNPIIYCSHITQLRNELKSMFHCKIKK